MAKLTIEDVRERVEDTYGGMFELISTEYVNTMVSVEIKCKRCGLVKTIPPNTIKCKPTWCASCDSNNAKLNTAVIANRIKEETDGAYELLGDYKNANTPVLVRHNSEECGYNEYMVRWYNFKSGRRCPKCRTKFSETKKKNSGWEAVFMEELSEYGYEFISSETKKKKDKVEINNVNCKHASFLMSPDKFHRGQRCPLCPRSTGEERIANYLTDENIPFEIQFSFPDLIYKKPLKFDFAVLKHDGNLDFIIEFDGKQHFEPVKYWGGKDNYNKQVEKDKMKNEYCKSKGIELLRIPYWDFENIENILGEIKKVKL